MKNISCLAAVALLATGTTLAAGNPESWDGLIEVKPRNLQVAYLMPGADFRPYVKVMLDPTEVAFRKDWIRDQNEARRSARRITDSDVTEIIAAARSNFDDVFADAFTKAGYAVTTTPSADTMRVSAAVMNLYVNAVDPIRTGGDPVITAEAGEATLVVELRDSMTGALLGRVLERRVVEHIGDRPQVSTSVSNKQDFRALFERWAEVAATGLGRLQAVSPIPASLKPGQTLP